MRCLSPSPGTPQGRASPGESHALTHTPSLPAAHPARPGMPGSLPTRHTAPSPAFPPRNQDGGCKGRESLRVSPGQHPEPAWRGKGGQQRGGGLRVCRGARAAALCWDRGWERGTRWPSLHCSLDHTGVQPGREGSHSARQLLAELPGSHSGTLRGSRRGAAPSEHPCSPQSKVPGVSLSPPTDDSYEDAEPLGPGRCTGSGEHPTAPPPRHPHAPSTLMPSRLSGGADSDSSHYESYGEDEDSVTDRAHYLWQPTAAGPDAEAPGRPEAQLCGFLWRKRWLGQWAKQLFIVREHVLLVSGRRRMDGGWEGVPELC